MPFTAWLNIFRSGISMFSITSSILAMIVLFLYSRESVLVSYESFDRDVPVVPLPTGQEISFHHSEGI